MRSRDCAVCGWQSRDGLELPGWCERCRGRTIADVADLPDLYRTLGEVMRPGAEGERQRVGGSKAPPLPFRLDAANLRGPATAGELPGTDNAGALSIATVLAATRLAIQDACDLTPLTASARRRYDTQALVGSDATFVVGFLPRYAEVAESDALAGVVDILHDTRQRAWHACGYGAHKVYLGPCPYTGDAGPTGPVCGRELWIDPVMADSVTCRDCGTRWDRRFFLWLRRQAEEAR